MTHGVVLAVRASGDDKFGRALLDDGASSRFDLDCGLRTPFAHALRSLSTLRRRCRAITVVCDGDAHAEIARRTIDGWRAEGALDVTCEVEVIGVDEGAGTGEALAACEGAARRSGATTLLVVHADVVTDANVDEIVNAHMARGGVATVALARRRPWALAERKVGKAPKGVRYVGVSASEGEVVYLAGGENHDEAKKRLKLQRSALDANREMVIRTDIVDVGIYILDPRATFDALKRFPYLKSVQFDLVPHFVAEQFRGAKDAVVAAYVVPADKYCVAIDTAKPALLEASREIASEFHHLNDRPLSKYDNVLDHSTVMGSKSTIGPGCAVGGLCVFGDKCSVKKSVIAPECKIGSGVKIVNSLILRGAVIGDGAQIQGCIVGPCAVVGAHVTAKDSVIGAGYKVDDDEDVDGETLPKKD